MLFDLGRRCVRLQEIRFEGRHNENKTVGIRVSFIDFTESSTIDGLGFRHRHRRLWGNNDCVKVSPSALDAARSPTSLFVPDAWQKHRDDYPTDDHYWEYCILLVDMLSHTTTD